MQHFVCGRAQPLVRRPGELSARTCITFGGCYEPGERLFVKVRRLHNARRFVVPSKPAGKGGF